MQSIVHSALLDALPLHDLALLLGVFATAALVLFALSVEAGNYPTISRIISQVRLALQHDRSPDGDYAKGRHVVGH